MSEEDWKALKAASRAKSMSVVMGCGKPGIPVTRRGTQYFAHKRGVDCNMHEGGEGKEHFAAKLAIEAGLIAAGWAATIEAPSPDRSWIADVLAEKDGRKIAFEVQWSPQATEDFQRRQERYERDGVECMWLVWQRNKINAEDVPRMVVHGEVDGFQVTLPNGFGDEKVTVPLGQAAAEHATGRYRQQIDPQARRLLLWVIEKDCYRQECAKPMSIWYLHGLEVETACGLQGSMTDDGPSQMNPQARVESTIASWVLPKIRESGLNEPAILATRRSKWANASYLAYCCPRCGTPHSDYYNFRYRGQLFSLPAPGGDFKIPLTKAALTVPHVCGGVSGVFCEQHEPSTEVAFPSMEDSWISTSREDTGELFPPIPSKAQVAREREEAAAARAEREAREEAYDLALRADSMPSAAIRMHPPRSAEPLVTERPPEIQDNRMQERWAALDGSNRPEESAEPDPLLMSAEDCVASLGQNRLRLALFHAIEHLDRGSLKQVEAAKRAKGEANLYPVLLGDLYPEKVGATQRSQQV